MRLKKQKRHRKVVRFFSACFGFREPYKVLCDGTFIHHLVLHGLIPADDFLSNLLGARVLLFTSKCVIGELTSLGESHATAVEAAHQIMTATCDHEKRVDAETCIQSIIGESNSEHFFLATQDSEIRKKFRALQLNLLKKCHSCKKYQPRKKLCVVCNQVTTKSTRVLSLNESKYHCGKINENLVPGVPIIYGLRNSLFLEQPSFNQKEFVKSTEEKRLHLNESEYQKIWKRQRKEKLTSAGADSSLEVDFAKRNRNILVDKIRFTKRRAMGPNPLSCKKKKQKDGTSLTKNQNELAAGTLNKRKRIRRRKRDSKES